MCRSNIAMAIQNEIPINHIQKDRIQLTNSYRQIGRFQIDEDITRSQPCIVRLIVAL